VLTFAVYPKSFCAGAFLFAAIQWLSLDAAANGRLGASTPRCLNKAIAATSVGIATVSLMGQASGLPTNAINQAVLLVICGLDATVYGYQAVQAPEDV